MVESYESHIDVELYLRCSVAKMTLPDVYVGLEVGLLAPGDGVVTDRHHASSERYEADDPQNQIGGQISPFTLSGWLRHGRERVMQITGGTACHPGEPNADYMRADVYDRDLEHGYHEKGSCRDGDEPGCVVHELFGGFGDQPGKLLWRPIQFSPIRRQVDVLRGESEAHYRQLSTQVRSRNEHNGGQPLRPAEGGVVGNLEGMWLLTLREVKPEFVGLLLGAMAFLDAHSSEFDLQLGGARNYGLGETNVADTQVIDLEELVYSRVRNADAHVVEIVSPFVLASGAPGADAQSVPWWWACDRDNVRLRETRLARGGDVYTVEVVNYRQLVEYTGCDPVQTALNGVIRVGTNSKFGFGELRVRPDDANRVTESVDVGSASDGASAGGEAR